MHPDTLTRQQIRQFDQVAIEHFGMDSLVLMENAARGAADALCQAATGTSAVVICGAGNNGGDGLAMARHLHFRGWQLKVILLAKTEKLSQDSAANWRILTQTRVPLIDGTAVPPQQIAGQISGYSWIVDAVVGTGARPPLREPYSRWIRAANLADARRLAVDLPSGLDCDSDQASGEVFKADLTVTFVARKPVMATETGKHWCGRTRIADIGAPPETFDHIDGDHISKGD